MFRSLRIASLTLGGLMLTAGCQQRTEMVSSPGALPRMNLPDEQIQINTTTMFAHAHLLERQGAFERAVIQYQNVLADKPDFVTARNRLGITLNKLGRHAEATEQFRICVAQEPTQAHLHNNLGFSLYLENRYAEAEKAIAQSLRLDPDFDRAHMNHAIVLAKLGRHRDAFEELKQIGSEADACFNMGILLTEAGQYTEAAQYLEAALADNPKFDAAREQLLEVSRLAAESEARKMARMTAADASRPTGQPGHPAQTSTPPMAAGPAPHGSSPATASSATRTPASPGVQVENIAFGNKQPAVARSTQSRSPAAAAPAQAPARHAGRSAAPAHARAPIAAQTHDGNGTAGRPQANRGPTTPPSLQTPMAGPPQVASNPHPAAKPQRRAPQPASRSGQVVVETIDLTQSPARAHTTNTPATPPRPAAAQPATPRPAQPAATASANRSTPRQGSGVIVEEINVTPRNPRPQQPIARSGRVGAVLANRPGPETAKTIAKIIDLLDDEMRLSTHVDEQGVTELRCRIEALLDPRMDARRAAAIESDTAAGRLDTLLADAEVRAILKAKGLDSD